MLKRRGDRREDIVSECTRIIDRVLIGTGKLSPPKKKLSRAVPFVLFFLGGFFLGGALTLLLLL